MRKFALPDVAASSFAYAPSTFLPDPSVLPVLETHVTSPLYMRAALSPTSF